MTCDACQGEFVVTLVRVLPRGGEVHYCRECAFGRSTSEPTVAPKRKS